MIKNESAYSYCVVLEYDGREYFGWQRLRDKPTIQGTLEQAIEAVWGKQLRVQGAGRTDRGAHAKGQVAGFQLGHDLPICQIEQELNAQLPNDIRIRDARRVTDDFHARQSAVKKEYDYLIAVSDQISTDLVQRVWHAKRSLDVQAMQRAVRFLQGKHDFASFATKQRFTQKSTVRDLSLASLEQNEEMLRFRFHADSFLSHMVRNMVRLVTKVGEGRYPPEQVRKILQAKDRRASPGSAPACGLYLMRVHYPDWTSNTEWHR